MQHRPPWATLALLSLAAGCANVPTSAQLNLALPLGEVNHGFTLGSPAVRGVADELEGASYSPSEDRLIIQPGGYFESQPISVGVPFDELLLSWNIAVPEAAGALLEAAVRVDRSSPWSPWLHMADWDRGVDLEPGPVEFAAGKVHVDILRLSSLHQQARYRIRALGGPIEVLGSALCFSNSKLDLPDTHRDRVEAIQLDVPLRSQRES